MLCALLFEYIRFCVILICGKVPLKEIGRLFTESIMLSKFKYALAAASLLVASVGVNAATVSTIGDVVEVAPGVYQIDNNPNSLTATNSELEQFAGLANGALDLYAGENVRRGSAIKSTIEVEAGDVLTMDWAWKSSEPNKANVNNDFAFFSMSLIGIKDVLASVAMNGASDSGTYTWKAAAAGTLTYVVGVVNAIDNKHLSRLTVSKLSPVPVPAAALLFGSALLGFAGFSARRKIS